MKRKSKPVEEPVEEPEQVQESTAPIPEVEPPAYLRCFIMMPGENDIPLDGITGISLRMVPRETMVKHEGLKYWIAAYSSKADIMSEAMLKALSDRARADILSLMFFKKPPQFDGFYVNAESKIFEGKEAMEL